MMSVFLVEGRASIAASTACRAASGVQRHRRQPSRGMENSRPSRGCGRDNQWEVCSAAFRCQRRVDFFQPGQAGFQLIEAGNGVQLIEDQVQISERSRYAAQ